MPIVTIIRDDGGLESLDLEEYVRGVLPLELSTGMPIEALKAQAVAARSYAVKKAAPLFTDTRDQVYGPGRFADTDAAVTATAGQILGIEGRPIMAFFFGHCDGRTHTTAEQGWTGAQDPDCFPSVACECGFDALFGHGIGMCQRGAIAMANRGATYREILTHYYRAQLVDAATMQPLGGDDDDSAGQQGGGDEWYTVQPGDSLSAIADRFGTTVAAIEAANAGLITNPNVIAVGWLLRIPGAAPEEYVVQGGDTLAGLAQRWGVTVDAIAAANPSLLRPGETLVRPR